ncbi:MAG: type IV-A pilus assembly ATPase PilB [Legionellales bacterium]|nr:type IV-A pilus assembly ATPase PilB [Legionellales bacterium]
MSGLARRFVVDGLLGEDKALKAQQEATEKNQTLVNYLVENNILNPADIASTASQDFGLPLIDLNAFDSELLPRGVVSEKLITKHHALPLLHRGDRLYVAISDPTNLAALNDFKFHTGINTHGILVEENKLAKIIEDVLEEQEAAALGDLTDTDLDELDITTGELEQDDVSDKEAEDAPIVRFVNKILIDAINKGVSDIHFEPYEKKYRVRYRRDGILYETAVPPLNLAPKITARLKVLSRLDISERRIPQDGHFKMVLSKNRAIDFRVSSCPTVGGEKVVLRVLDPSSAKIGIDELGYEKFQKEMFLTAIGHPQGMVLVTGPTGSGKTISLYTALNILNEEERNISTIEDPVEINLPGINQVNVNTKAGLDFATALRAFLRQDPDIVMVGEIRDLETAEIAIKAAQTGHLVLSTLHTNSAPETLTRLANMGVPTFNIATSVSLIIAQRLARRLCTHCRVTEDVPADTLLKQGFTKEQVKDITLYTNNIEGCEHCKNGYAGRVGLYEVLEVTNDIGKIIMEEGTSLDIMKHARDNGFQTLRESGLVKVYEGITSLEEINRVTKD